MAKSRETQPTTTAAVTTASEDFVKNNDSNGKREEAEQSSSGNNLWPTIVISVESDEANILSRAWLKAVPSADIRIMSPCETLAQTFESLVANDYIPDEFIFIPGICIPIGTMSPADLALFRKRALATGAIVHTTGLPMVVSKEKVVDALTAFEGETNQTDENMMRHYNAIAHAGEVATLVSMHYGNSVVYALHSDICTAKLIDALYQKKFICLNPAALPVALRFLEEYVKD